MSNYYLLRQRIKFFKKIRETKFFLIRYVNFTKVVGIYL